MDFKYANDQIYFQATLINLTYLTALCTLQSAIWFNDLKDGLRNKLAIILPYYHVIL